MIKSHRLNYFSQLISFALYARVAWSALLWLVYHDCAWLAKLASIARTMLGLLGSVDCTWLAHSKSSLHSQGSKLTSTCFAGVVWFAWLGHTSIGSLARGARFANTTELVRVWRLFAQPSFLELPGLSISLTLMFEQILGKWYEK